MKNKKDRMSFQKKLFATPILFGLFFLLVPYNNNITEVPITDFLFVCGIFLPLIALFTFITRILIKENVKSFLVSTITTILFFSYIPIYNIIFENQSNIITENHVILFLFMFSILIILIALTIKSKRNFENFLKISFMIAFVLISMNIVEIGIYNSTNELFLDNSVEISSLNNDSLRDVYHILLDEHASTSSLKNYFNYDNSNFENFLKDEGFFIPEFSIANYKYTAYAIPSILNMDYITTEWESEKELETIAKRTLEENSVTKNFKQLDYEIISIHNEYNFQPSEDAIIKCDSNVRSLKLLFFYIDNTPLTIVKNLGFSILDQTSNSGKGDRSYQPLIENRVCAFNELLNIEKEFPKPIFFHAHLNLPHSPYLFDSDGNIINTRSLTEDQIPSAYLEQLQYTDNKIMEIVKKLLEKEPKPIIIIQSDHGFRFKIDSNDDELKHSFLNFQAFYFPDKKLDVVKYAEISPVNSFRILFNEYFDTDYELLKNKSFLMDGSKFVDITDFVVENSNFKGN